MRRDTKLNLLFLGLFLAISLPGAIILFKKKLQPGERPIDLRDAVRREVAYIDPFDTPPSMRRVVPPITRAWVAQVSRVTTLPEPPVLSAERGFEWLGANDPIVLFVWDPQISQAPEIRATVNGVDAQRVEVTGIELPREVRTELQDLGFIRPPQRVAVVRVWATANSPATLTLSAQNVSESLSIPPAATSAE